MSIETDLRSAAARAHTDSLLLHQIVHGSAMATITTEGGPVKSIAKVIVDVETGVAGHLTDISDGVAAAETARQASEAARDDALTAKNETLFAVGTVAVSLSDTTPGRLADKIQSELGVEIKTSNPSANEQLSIAIAPQIHTGALLALARSFV